MNSHLSICIPTYNRAAILRDGLNYLIPLVSRFQIPIYISDNASTDDTVRAVMEATTRYPLVFFHRNAYNIGMDGNFEVVLKLSSTRYAWLLGDDDRIHPDSLEEVLKLLSNSLHDLLLLNGGSADRSKGRVAEHPSRVYDDAAELLYDIGWHATWISSLVISSPLIGQMNFKKYIGSYFSHFGSLFEALGGRPIISVYWHDRSSFFPSSAASFSWTSRVLEIFSEKWVNVVVSLPDNYPIRAKHECILAHSRHTGLFSVMGLMNLRAQGALSRRKITQYSRSLCLASQTDIRIAYFIASIPVWLLKWARWVYMTLRFFVVPRPVPSSRFLRD